MNDLFDLYRSGLRIYGDDFSSDEIDSWFQDEAEGYTAIVPDEHRESFDEYGPQTQYYLYQHIKGSYYPNVLCYGGGYATELLPIINQVGDITVLEPGAKFRRDTVGGKPCRYIVPNSSGQMDFPNNSFNLITCLGVLHHIPNVSYILTEMHRVLADGGVLLIREPITSMNVFDNNQRKGLTKRERGLPLGPFVQSIRSAHLTITHQNLYGFGPLFRLFSLGALNNKACRIIKDSEIMMSIDAKLSQFFLPNYIYDSKRFIKKFRPTVVAMVVRK